MKCFKCGVDKPITEFSTNGAGKYKKRCKPCRTADELERFSRKSPAERQARFRYLAEWVKRNPDKYREYARRTRKANPETYRLKVQLRRRRHRSATPAWADKRAIAALYRKAAELTASTGIPHEVDHIVPLLSPLVCGLHCEANLQILPMVDNRRKNNRLWPDMP